MAGIIAGIGICLFCFWAMFCEILGNSTWFCLRESDPTLVDTRKDKVLWWIANAILYPISTN